MIEIKLHRLSSTGKYAWVAALVVLALAFPAAAAAQGTADCAGPTGDQYCPNTQVLTAGGSGDDPADPSADADSSSALPFTGFDLVLSLAAGAGLLGVGLALRRATRSGSAA